ncbi:MAG: sugar ABC transporter ATP-binding protein [Chloroflexi bacterium]|nr:sugar ABC transporter ATP-binding protein [Chloroflexota bacterium]MYA91911.1 sugar ABC transporter ATP-binding protein [Chloroflexota bacterium]MYC55738.1 sugar ABC transporter ATP-binding protein [Chloroflexota bacterium]MYD39188.1 sugar ABC transporter ATP-binding protein [Chloroflexota bacterium]MYE78755.1 sugar ABC transporter ATP-binding protein [Chloroflexota bacterium]
MRGICKSFAGVQALKDVSFRCQAGLVYGLVGENGAGKSTLMKILAGAYKADAGEIIYKGMPRHSASTGEIIASGISIIYQELALVPQMSVAENIFLGREPRNALGILDLGWLRARAEELLSRLGVTLDTRSPVSELTIAQQQLVEIAKALSQDADLIVMDEPSAILAGGELDQLFAIIAALKAQGVTIVYISHRLEEVFRIADEVTVLKDGEVVDSRPIQQLDRATLVRLMVGRSLEEIFPQTDHAQGELRLSAEGIATDSILDGVSLRLHAGEILGIAGMVGSGRTELARALFGADPLTQGEVRLVGESLQQLPQWKTPSQAIRAGLVLVPEDRKSQGLFTALSVRVNITIPILSRLSRLGIIRRAAEEGIVTGARQRLSIVMNSPDQETQYLSGGNQQKVVLAKWLETEPSVIILDEPTRGVDVGAKFEIYKLMRQLNDRGIAIIMISSELPEIIGMSDRILVMNDGRVAGEISRAEADEERIIELATLGAEAQSA